MKSLVSLVEVDPPGDRPDERVGAITLSDIDQVTATVDPLTPSSNVETEIVSARRIARPGDVLVARISPSLENGKLAVVPPLPKNAVRVSSELFVLRPREGISAEEIWAFFRQDRLRRQLATLATGSAGYRRIDRTALERLELPDRARSLWEEAKRPLVQMDAAIAKRRLVIARLQQLPGLAMAAASVGAPEVELTKLAKLRSGYNGPLEKNGERAVLRRPDLIDGSIGATPGRFLPSDPARVAPSLRRGDLLMASQAGQMDQLGSVAVYDGEDSSGITFSSGLVRIRPVDVEPDLLWALLQTPATRSFLLSQAARESARPRVSLASLGHTLVPFIHRRLEGRMDLTRLARLLRLLLARNNRQLDLLLEAVQAHLGQVFAGTAFSEPDLSAAPVVIPVAPALQPVFEAASPAQRDVWRQVASQGQAFRVADLEGAEEDRASVQHTLSILEQLGVLVRESEGVIESWRPPRPEEEPTI